KDGAQIDLLILRRAAAPPRGLLLRGLLKPSSIPNATPKAGWISRGGAAKKGVRRARPVYPQACRPTLSTLANRKGFRHSDSPRSWAPARAACICPIALPIAPHTYIIEPRGGRVAMASLPQLKTSGPA